MARAEAPGLSKVIAPCCSSRLPLAQEKARPVPTGEWRANPFTSRRLSLDTAAWRALAAELGLEVLGLALEDIRQSATRGPLFWPLVNRMQ